MTRQEYEEWIELARRGDIEKKAAATHLSVSVWAVYKRLKRDQKECPKIKFFHHVALKHRLIVRGGDPH
jgi:hypothetical protein